MQELIFKFIIDTVQCGNCKNPETTCNVEVQSCLSPNPYMMTRTRAFAFIAYTRAFAPSASPSPSPPSLGEPAAGKEADRREARWRTAATVTATATATVNKEKKVRRLGWRCQKDGIVLALTMGWHRIGADDGMAVCGRDTHACMVCHRERRRT